MRRMRCALIKRAAKANNRSVIAFHRGIAGGQACTGTFFSVVADLSEYENVHGDDAVDQVCRMCFSVGQSALKQFLLCPMASRER